MSTQPQTRHTRLSRRTMIFAGPALGAAAAFGPAQAHAQKGARPALPIPTELRANAEGAIAIDAQPGSMRFQSGPATATYGINGPYLGPTLRLRRGQKVVAKVQNGVPQPITMHWHGLIIPGAVDGGPHRVLLPGAHWWPELSIDQPAATLWFHPHLYPTTAELVIKGLAGLLLIDDDETDRLPLPSRWGVDDLPLIIQDRRFAPDGQFFDRFNIVAVTNGYVGDTVLADPSRPLPDPDARAVMRWYYGVGKRVWPHEVWNFLFCEKRRRDGPTLTEFWGPPLDAEEAAMRRVMAAG